MERRERVPGDSNMIVQFSYSIKNNTVIYPKPSKMHFVDLSLITINLVFAPITIYHCILC